MISVILSVIVEYIIFAYYLNAVDNMKRQRIYVNIITACIYAGYAVICIFSPAPIMNVITFFAMNVMILCIAWEKSMLFNALNCIGLTAFMMFSELLVGVVFDIGVSNPYTMVTEDELYILLAFSKLIYFICVAILRRFAIQGTGESLLKEEILFLMLPIATCAFFNTFAKIRLQLDANGHSNLVFVSALLILANVLVYLVYNMITDKNTKIRVLEEIEHKREIEHSSYAILKERYDDLKLMIHDFEKYCNNIEGLIETEPDKAMREITSIRNRNRTLLLVERTNNKALNVILDQKMRECIIKEIDFKIIVQHVDLSYISELDTVAIFSNLLDNAIEGCSKATLKIIRLDIFEMNDSYTAIKIVNSCGIKPKMKDGVFVTTKDNAINHGIGLKSVQRALNQYGAKIKYSYDQETETFSAVILINNSKKD